MPYRRTDKVEARLAGDRERILQTARRLVAGDGFREAHGSAVASMAEVVVFPCVPDTATVRRRATIAASMSARLSTGIPERRAMSISGLLSAIAVERVTRSAPVTRSAR